MRGKSITLCCALSVLVSGCASSRLTLWGSSESATAVEVTGIAQISPALPPLSTTPRYVLCGGEKKPCRGATPKTLDRGSNSPTVVLPMVMAMPAMPSPRAKTEAAPDDGKNEFLVHFTQDSNTLDETAKNVLDVAAKHAGDDATLKVQANTDAAGTQMYNGRLAKRRTDVVRAYLVAKGIPHNRIEANSAASSENEVGRVANHRSPITVTVINHITRNQKE